MKTDVKLSESVAEEIRAMMARKRMSGRQLAEELGVSRMWVSYRLTGDQEIGLNDLQRIAVALDVTVAELLPRGLADRSGVNTTQYPVLTESTTPGGDERRIRPIGPRIPGQPSATKALPLFGPQAGTVDTIPFQPLPAPRF